jgi:hypothetical protein
MRAIRPLAVGTCFLLLVWLAPAGAAPPYADLDRHALAVSDRDEASVERLAAALTDSAATDREKARAIFRWIAAHISYDEEAYYSGRYGDTSPEAVLHRRASVCAGYAHLYEALARAAGLEAVRVAGHAKGVSYRLGAPVTGADHEWNAVKLDGRWYLLDVTWGAGLLMGQGWTRHFNEHYFLTPPEEFIYDHFPNDAQWQLLDPPRTRDEYAQLAYLRPEFFQHGLKVGSHPRVRLQADASATLTFTGPDDLQLTARLFRESGAAVRGNWVLCQHEAGAYQVRVRWPRPGEYRLLIFVKGAREQGALWEAAEYLVEGRGGAQAGFPVTTATFGEWGVALRAPTSGTLAAGRPQTFSLTVPRAKQVSVVSHARWQHLERHGEEFTGIVTPTRGKLQLLADSWVLAEYDVK